MIPKLNFNQFFFQKQPRYTNTSILLDSILILDTQKIERYQYKHNLDYRFCEHSSKLSYKVSNWYKMLHQFQRPGLTT